MPLPTLAKRNVKTFLWLLLLLVFALAFPDARATAPQMFGVNLSGGEFGSSLPGSYGTDYIYPSAAEFDYYSSRGQTFIRLPFRWERVQHSLNATLDATEIGRLDTVIGYARARGMKVLLDMHNYNFYSISGVDYMVGSTQVPISALQNVWGQLAAHYKNEPAIYGYDIMNEPQGTLANWQSAAQAVVNTIRQSDTIHYVFIEGVNWSGSQTWATSNSTLSITDSANLLVYSAHSYWNANHDGTYGSNEQGTASTGVNFAQPFVSWIQSHGYNGHIGEYGVPNNGNNYLASWETALDGFLSYLKTNNISGTYWSGGPWWGTYPLSCEPVNSVDALQMAVLKNYGQAAGQPSAVINFSGVETALGMVLGNGWWGNPTSSYQPLLQTYAGLQGTNSSTGYVYNTAADGGNLGVTCDFTGALTSTSGGGHTGDAPDYGIQAWSSSTLATFSAPVVLTSLWLKADYNAGASGTTLQAFTNSTDTTPVTTVAIVNTNGGWIQITALAAYPIKKLSLVLPNGNVSIDDITVTLPSPKTTVINFSGVEPAAGMILGNGWWGNPSSSYQPLLQTYPGLQGTNPTTGYVYNTVADGANLGVTADFTQSVVGVGGHTGDAPDYSLVAWSNTNPWNLATFSAPVKITSVWIKGDYNAAAGGATLRAFTLPTDTTPIATVPIVNTNGGWVQVTALAGYPIRKLTLVLPNGNVLLDDIAVTTP